MQASNALLKQLHGERTSRQQGSSGEGKKSTPTEHDGETDELLVLSETNTHGKKRIRACEVQPSLYSFFSGSSCQTTSKEPASSAKPKTRKKRSLAPNSSVSFMAKFVGIATPQSEVDDKKARKIEIPRKRRSSTPDQEISDQKDCEDEREHSQEPKHSVESKNSRKMPRKKKKNQDNNSAEEDKDKSDDNNFADPSSMIANANPEPLRRSLRINSHPISISNAAMGDLDQEPMQEELNSVRSKSKKKNTRKTLKNEESHPKRCASNCECAASKQSRKNIVGSIRYRELRGEPMRHREMSFVTSSYQPINQLKGHDHDIFALEFDESGDLLVAAGGAGNLSIFSTRKPLQWMIQNRNDYLKFNSELAYCKTPVCDGFERPLFSNQVHARWISSAFFVPKMDSTLMSCSDDGSIKMYRYSKFKTNDSDYLGYLMPQVGLSTVIDAPYVHAAGIYSMHMLESVNDTIVTGSKDTSAIVSKITSVAINPVRQFNFSEEVIKCVRWKDENVFASCGNDKMINLYDIRSDEPVLSLVNFHELSINSIRFNPNFVHYLLSTSFDKTLSVCDLRYPNSPMKSLKMLLSDAGSGGRTSTIVHPQFLWDSNEFCIPVDSRAGIQTFCGNCCEPKTVYDVPAKATSMAVCSSANTLATANRKEIFILKPSMEIS